MTNEGETHAQSRNLFTDDQVQTMVESCRRAGIEVTGVFNCRACLKLESRLTPEPGDEFGIVATTEDSIVAILSIVENAGADMLRALAESGYAPRLSMLLAREPGDAWRNKARSIISAECSASYKAVNFTKAGKKLKKHVPHTVPPIAQALVECLQKNDECRAKAIFLALNEGQHPDTVAASASRNDVNNECAQQ